MTEIELVKLLAAAERERTLVIKADISPEMKARLCASIDVRVRQAELALKAAADAPVQGAGAPKGR